MIPEPYLGILVGFALTLGGAVVSIVLTNHYSWSHWVKTRSVEQREQLVQEVFSPLLFLFTDANKMFAFVEGSIKSVMKIDFSNKAVREKALAILCEYCKALRNDEMKNILMKWLGSIVPREFRNDLFSYFIYSRLFGDKLELVCVEGSRTENIKTELENLRMATNMLSAIAIRITGLLERFISLKGELPPNYPYLKIFDVKTQTEMWGLITGPLTDEQRRTIATYDEEISKRLADFKKEIV